MTPTVGTMMEAATTMEAALTTSEIMCGSMPLPREEAREALMASTSKLSTVAAIVKLTVTSGKFAAPGGRGGGGGARCAAFKASRAAPALSIVPRKRQIVRR